MTDNVDSRHRRWGLARASVAAAAIAALCLPRLLPAQAAARPAIDLGDGPRLGITLGLYASDPAYDYGELVAEIADHGANAICLVVVWRQDDVAATEVRRVEGRTALDDAIRRTLRQAHALGLETMLLPIVLLVDEGEDDVEWRGTLRPRDVGAWFASYRALLVPLARLAAEERAGWIVVGSELCSLESFGDEWRTTLRDVRAAFPGRLTYSANWDHLDDFAAWRDLDAMGMSGYFELATTNNPTHAELVASWRRWQREIRDTRARLGIADLPLLFTELGYHSQDGVARQPWDYTLGKPLDLDEQLLCFEAFFDAWRAAPELRGVFVYTWFGVGGPHDGDYAPRGKPAAALIRREFLDWERRKIHHGGTESTEEGREEVE